MLAGGDDDRLMAELMGSDPKFRLKSSTEMRGMLKTPGERNVCNGSLRHIGIGQLALTPQ